MTSGEYWSAVTAIFTFGLALVTGVMAWQTRSVALATKRLAKQTGDELRELTRQHDAAQDAKREDELRAWAVELRRHLSLARSSILERMKRSQITEAWQTSAAASAPGHDYGLVSGAEWHAFDDDWRARSSDLSAYMDLIGFLDPTLVSRLAAANTDLEQATADQDVQGFARAGEAVANILEDITVAIDERLGLDTAMRRYVASRDRIAAAAEARRTQTAPDATAPDATG